MAEGKHQFKLSEPNIKRILDAGRIETELECEQVALAKRYLAQQEKSNPELDATIDALRNLIFEFEGRRWSDRSTITDAQIEESESAVNQAEKEFVLIRKRRKLILAKLREFSLKQKDLALLLSHSKSYTSELLNGLRPFSSNDLKLIHLLFKIPLDDLVITIASQETLSRLENTIDKISVSNPQAKLLRSALAGRPLDRSFLLEDWNEQEPKPEEPSTEELPLSNK